MRSRIETATAAFHVRWLELLRELPGDPGGVSVRDFGGGVVATAAARLPDVQWMQHVSGLQPMHVDRVREIADWYAGLGVRPRFEIAPTLDFEPLAAALAATGARHSGFIDALWCPMDSATPQTPPNITVRRVGAGSDDAERFARLHFAGHEVPGAAVDEHWTAVAGWAEQPGWSCYIATVGGQDVAAAALTVFDGVGYLANASTIPAGRGYGAQQALIHRRIRVAAAAGCDVVVTLANPFTPSHRNLERAGLRVAYTKAVWTVL